MMGEAEKARLGGLSWAGLVDENQPVYCIIRHRIPLLGPILKDFATSHVIVNFVLRATSQIVPE